MRVAHDMSAGHKWPMEKLCLNWTCTERECWSLFSQKRFYNENLSTSLLIYYYTILYSDLLMTSMHTQSWKHGRLPMSPPLKLQCGKHSRDALLPAPTPLQFSKKDPNAPTSGPIRAHTVLKTFQFKARKLTSWIERLGVYFDASGFDRASLKVQQQHTFACLDSFVTESLRRDITDQTNP